MGSDIDQIEIGENRMRTLYDAKQRSEDLGQSIRIESIHIPPENEEEVPKSEGTKRQNTRNCVKVEPVVASDEAIYTHNRFTWAMKKARG